MKPVLLVVAPYYREIADMLISGATHALHASGRSVEMLTVPGALEIPGAIAMALRNNQYSGYVALGCVIRGETSHYDIVSEESAHALQLLAIGHHHAAIGNGILTCETMEQAVVRADTKQGNKGGEAARATLRMMELRHHFAVENA